MTFHCAPDNQGWTDPTSNLTSVAEIDISKHLGLLLQEGKYPQASFPAFLHEGVHHWCFLSPVGTALALLKMRARRNASKISAQGIANSDDDLRFSVLEDALRFETAIFQLRPLAEGLALFAEFDATPNPKSEIVSLPFQIVRSCFIDALDKEAHALQQFLEAARLSDYYVDRKTSVLLGPLNCADGGYLLGYLTVKNIFAICESQSASFADTELFMMYVRSYIYEDLGLVDVLLSSDTSEIESANAISTYIQKRISQAVELNFEMVIPAFIRAIAETPLDDASSFFHLPRLGIDEATAERGWGRLNVAVQELEEGTREILDSWMLARRELMCMASSQISVEVTNSASVLLRSSGSVFAKFPAVDGVCSMEGPGTVEFYVAPSRGHKLVTVTCGTVVVAVALVGSKDLLSEGERTAIQEDLVRFSTSRVRALADAAEADRNLQEVVNYRDGKTSVLFEVFRESNIIVTNEIYRRWALPRVPAEHLHNCAQRMDDQGLLGLLDGDIDLLKLLVFAGLVGSFTSDWNIIRQQLITNGFVADDLWKKLPQIQRQTSVMLLKSKGDALVPLI